MFTIHVEQTVSYNKNLYHSLIRGFLLEQEKYEVWFANLFGSKCWDREMVEGDFFSTIPILHITFSLDCSILNRMEWIKFGIRFKNIFFSKYFLTDLDICLKESNILYRFTILSEVVIRNREKEELYFLYFFSFVYTESQMQ